MSKILLVHGPNLNLLGEREPEIYGRETLADIVEMVRSRAEPGGHELLDFQSNSEGSLIDWLHEHKSADFLIINAGAFTHTSIALRDAIAGIQIPFVEVHISNVYKREEFRHNSYLSDMAVGVIVGLGVFGYELAMQYALAHMPASR